MCLKCVRHIELNHCEINYMVLGKFGVTWVMLHSVGKLALVVIEMVIHGPSFLIA